MRSHVWAVGIHDDRPPGACPVNNEITPDDSDGLRFSALELSGGHHPVPALNDFETLIEYSRLHFSDPESVQGVPGPA